MKQRIYCPDITCESCVKVLTNAFSKLQGIENVIIKDRYIDVTFDETLIKLENITQTIKDKGYRAILGEEKRKTITERAKEFLKDKKKYEVEYLMLKNISITFVLMLFIEGIVVFYKHKTNTEFLTTYGVWLLYLAISIATLGGAIWHIKAYKTQYTCMIGMMIGMTIGMQSGLLIGSIIGATNGFFIGALTGMLLGAGIGAYCGKCCGIMGLMEGLMAGVMGGTMGPMISLMMFNDHLVWFMPFFIALNMLVLFGLSYMIYEEAVEDNENIIRQPMQLGDFFINCSIVLLLLTGVMLYAPPSVFIGG
ncbi:heavy metal translocating P-type ATPase [Candidatus Woesearchaeota archaeon]|nr:heavy metal translocating P-type ATPase [Candidatus Woesearchaeota archaeon]